VQYLLPVGITEGDISEMKVGFVFVITPVINDLKVIFNESR